MLLKLPLLLRKSGLLREFDSQYEEASQGDGVARSDVEEATPNAVNEIPKDAGYAARQSSMKLAPRS